MKDLLNNSLKWAAGMLMVAYSASLVILPLMLRVEHPGWTETELFLQAWPAYLPLLIAVWGSVLTAWLKGKRS